MSATMPYALAGAALVAIAGWRFFVDAHLLRRILALNVLGSGVFLLLVALAQRAGGADPVAQALVLTGIVVAVAATALAIVLTRRLFELQGRATLDAPRRR